MIKLLCIFLFFISFCVQAQITTSPPPSYNSIGIKIHLDETLNNPQLFTNLASFLKRKQIGRFSNNIFESTISLGFDGENYTISQLPENRIIYKIDNSKPNKTLQLIKDKIQQYAYGYQIKDLNLKNESFKFSFRIKPVDRKLNNIPLANIPKTNGNLNFNTTNSAAILEVSNLSENPIYFSVIEINSKGQLAGFIPNVSCALIGSERRIEPYKTVVFERCYFQFAPPYETLTLKGFASPEPINFNPIIRNEDNSSLEYIKDFYTDMYTYEFRYNIVDENGEMPYNPQIDSYQINTSPELEKALYELRRLNPDKGFKGLTGIIGSKKNQKPEFIKKLKDISEIHQSLGNTDEAREFERTYRELKAKQDRNNSLGQKKNNDRAKKEAAKQAMLFQKMTDAEKIAFLKTENQTKAIEISELKAQIKDLNEEIKTLIGTSSDNSQSRGSKPAKKERDIVSEFTYRALIIAEENYTDSSISDLKFPIDDAKELKNVLIDNYAFEKANITFLKNPTRKDIFQALDILFKTSSDKDHLLIFYAGHGVYDEDFKRGYWLPSDAELDNKSSWMSNLDIKDYISNIKTKHTLLISDACFSGSIFEYNRDVNIDTSSKALEKLLQKNARNAMTSGLDKPVPDESVFIKYLLKTLKENQTLHLKASDLFKTIQEVVLNNTENIPQYGVIQNANHEGGEFIFLKRDN